MSILIHVDDIMAFAKKEDQLNWLENKLKSEYTDVHVERGEKMSYLGMGITKDVTKGTISIDMSNYIDEVIEEYRRDTSSKMR